jgi:predicted extracellular nuclease
MTMIRRSSLLLVVFLVSLLPVYGQTRLVISQLYGGGGNSGSTYNYDFIELYNPTSAAISLSGYSVQYASATGTAWNSVSLPSASVAAGGYFLIQAASNITPAPTSNLPVTADFVISTNGSSGNPLNLSATAGKVAIVNGTTALSGACPLGTTVVDLIGYGPTASCYEGTGAAPAPSATLADIRSNLTTDNINNSTDYVTGAPNPHNSGSSSVPVPPAVVAIHTIQGVKLPTATAATVSPYVGQQVTTTGVVTAVLSNAFFIQSRDVDADADATTPEGVEVYTGSNLPAAAVIGNYVQVTATVATYPSASASHTPATELTSPTVTLLAAGVPLPTPVTLTAAMLTPSGGLYQLTPYEGMRVSVASLTAVSGTNGSITSANEPTETATSTGYFYAVITGTARPFREPGIDIRDAAVPGAPSGVAKFDDNPERILVDSTIAGGTSLEISTGAVLPNVTGVLDFTFSNDTYYDPSRLILDASYNRGSVTAGMTVQAVPLPGTSEFTVASFNIERFYNPSSADDLYYVPAGVNGYNGSSSTAIPSTGETFVSEAVDVTQAAYTRRLQKVSLAIRNVLNSPDIVTLEEVENQNVANDIAAQVNTDAGVANLYTAYSTDNSTYYSQDGTGISVGFLVKTSTVDTLGVTQYGQGETFTPTSSSSPIVLNDRPWLVLKAGIKRTGAKDYPVTVIVNHMKALTGENSTTSTSTRQKKELQAEDIAKYIQTLQAQGQHVISGGDFNAFEFSDGYTDTLGTYTNTNVLPATQVVQPGVAGLVTPPLTDLALLLPADQRYSYAEDGSAQILDHLVVTPELVTAGAHMAYAHLDADFPLTAYNDATTPARTSDHDAAVGYFTLPAPTLSATLTPATVTLAATTVGATSAGQVFTLTNTGEGGLTIGSVTTSGAFAANSSCGTTLAVAGTCSINVVFQPTAAGSQTGQLLVVTNASTTALTSALTGNGLLVPDFTIGDSVGKTTTAATVAAGSAVTVALTLTPNSTFSGSVALSCGAASGSTAPTGVTCTVPGTTTVTGSPVTQTIVFTTTSRVASSGLVLMPGGSRGAAMLVLAMAGLLLFLAGRSRRLGRLNVRAAGLLMLLAAICLPGVGCSSGGSKTNPNGTPAGTYTYTVTATSGTTAHAETVTLTVQ